jgi:ubiquinone/menaquinone biosynthesis C-methylase UbiE
MSWQEDVRSRFAPIEDSAKWDRMYAEDTVNLEDEIFRLRRDFTVDYVTKHYDASASICDLGCGAGPVTSELLRKGYEPVGMDFSRDMLDNAARRIATVLPHRRPLAQCDIQSLPLGDERFDCAVCLGVISYVEEYDNIVREIHRVLKPGGTAIITYRSEKNLMVSDPVGPFRYLAKKLRKRFAAGRAFRIGDHMSFSEVRRVVQGSGLQLIGFKGIGFGPLRFNHRKLFDERISIRIHRTLTDWLDRLGFELPFRVGTDVHVLIVRKPD